MGLLFGLLLSACSYISESTYDRQVDPDRDGAIVGEDCAPGDPTRSDLIEGFEDLDGDGFGGAPITVCGRLDGITQLAVGGDCDDADVAINPLADEVCNGIDDDCDGVFDASDPGLVDGIAFFEDADNDGTPRAGGEAVLRCEAPVGRAAAPVDGVWDCNDDDAAIGPTVAEVCDEVDNNCVDGIDEGLPALTSYLDQDEDGFGSTAQVEVGCQVPPGFVLDASDCDDTDPHISPGADESCANGVDEDCDGHVDEEGGAVLRYRDADLDGFSDGSSAMLCEQPDDGWLAVLDPHALDCDDGNPSLFPGAPDLPYDGIDSDCAGDDDYDVDGDGVQRLPEGLDCNDGDPTTYPGAPDAPYDGIDSDCAGDNDDDADGDGFTAEQEGGADCDDTDALIFPDAPDAPYDGVDSDCDDVDDYDADGDGYAPDDWAGLAGVPLGDCDDSSSAAYPGAPDSPYDGIDSDCAGDNDYDVDGDGHAPPTAVHAMLPTDDCDDLNPAVHGGALEVCNGVDDDCDGSVDGPGAGGDHALQALVDADGDGAPGVEIESVCAYGAGFVDPALGLEADCNDLDATVFPGADEVADDGIDQDCDGPDAVTCFIDADLDGVGATATSVSPTGTCAGSGLSALGDDCDDTDPETYPGAVELCDQVDQDCDGAENVPGITARRRDDGIGTVLWPGLLQTASGPVDITPYAEISFCGEGPWDLPSLAGSEGLVLRGISSPRPILTFTGSDPGLYVGTTEANVIVPVQIQSLAFRTQGRSPSDGAVVHVQQGDTRIEDVEFVDVQGEAAIRLQGQAGSIEPRASLFLSDVWAEAGQHARAPLVIEHSDGIIGGVYVFDNDTNVAGGLEAVSARLELYSSNYDSNISMGAGGLSLDGDSYVESQSVGFNGDYGGTGGAIFVGPQAQLVGRGDTFYDNSAVGPGALLVHGTARLENATLGNNTAGDNGGAILVERCGVLDCPHTDNAQPAVILADTELFGNTGNSGGALAVDGGSALLSGVDLHDNTAISNGGHIHASNLASVSIATSELARGNATRGGAVALQDAVGTITSSSLSENASTNDGGAVYGEGGSFVTIDGTGFYVNSSGGVGGAVALPVGGVFARDTFFDSNTAAIAGGGVFAEDFQGESANFYYNRATSGSGGGLHTVDGECLGCFFEGNDASGSGGGLNAFTFFAAGCVFQWNSARDGGGASGGVYANFSDFFDNTASDRGGALFHSNLQVYPSDNSYQYNSASQGGAIYSTDTMTEQYAYFIENTASEGGALYLRGATRNSSDCTYQDNAGMQGDLLYLASGPASDVSMLIASGSTGLGTVYHADSFALYSLDDTTTSLSCDEFGCTCFPTACP